MYRTSPSKLPSDAIQTKSPTWGVYDGNGGWAACAARDVADDKWDGVPPAAAVRRIERGSPADGVTERAGVVVEILLGVLPPILALGLAVGVRNEAEGALDGVVVDDDVAEAMRDCRRYALPVLDPAAAVAEEEGILREAGTGVLGLELDGLGLPRPRDGVVDPYFEMNVSVAGVVIE